MSKLFQSLKKTLDQIMIVCPNARRFRRLGVPSGKNGVAPQEPITPPILGFKS